MRSLHTPYSNRRQSESHPEEAPFAGLLPVFGRMESGGESAWR